MQWNIEGIELPYGVVTRRWGIAGGRLVDPIPGASTVTGVYVAPGLVDAHVHLTLPAEDGEPDLTPAEQIAASARRHVEAGVLAVRDTGSVRGVHLRERAGALRILSCGPMLVPAGRFDGGPTEAVEPGRLTARVAAAVDKGATWVKLIADFPGPDMNWFAAPPTYAIDEIAEAVAVAHRGGARVAAHVSSGIVGDLVRAGVDSIEHGPLTDPRVVAEMVDRGTAWAPTLSTVFAKYLDPLLESGTSLAEQLRPVYAGMEAALAAAVEAGVPLLAGSDERPHGSVALEVEQLVRFGLSGADALAAATTAPRAYLGLPALETGAPADLVLFPADPRTDVALLHEPLTVLAEGDPVAGAGLDRLLDARALAGSGAGA